jgi:hypothetical protein
MGTSRANPTRYLTSQAHKEWKRKGQKTKLIKNKERIKRHMMIPKLFLTHQI